MALRRAVVKFVGCEGEKGRLEIEREVDEGEVARGKGFGKMLKELRVRDGRDGDARTEGKDGGVRGDEAEGKGGSTAEAGTD